ncbi:MAG: hypothetical protein ACI83P_000703 [Janthinobacterium sp.]|jgi:hypothetical protein
MNQEGIKQVFPFSSRVEFERYLGLCLTRARRHLYMFDPDFALWGLGTASVDAELRHFLNGKGQIRMLSHDYSYLKSNCPRFLRLLQDFSHAIECRITHQNVRHRTDSFCIADDLHLVRRFHCDHQRGAATFDDASETSVCAELFDQIWRESNPGLHVGTTGL